MTYKEIVKAEEQRKENQRKLESMRTIIEVKNWEIVRLEEVC